MAQNDKIQLFEDKRIRTAWDEEKEEWYFSIVDVIAVLTDSPNPQTYWRVLKKRLKDEGNETVTSCNALKMTAADGKRRLTDVADPWYTDDFEATWQDVLAGCQGLLRELLQERGEQNG